MDDNTKAVLCYCVLLNESRYLVNCILPVAVCGRALTPVVGSAFGSIATHYMVDDNLYNNNINNNSDVTSTSTTMLINTLSHPPPPPHHHVHGVLLKPKSD